VIDTLIKVTSTTHLIESGGDGATGSLLSGNLMEDRSDLNECIEHHQGALALTSRQG